MSYYSNTAIRNRLRAKLGQQSATTVATRAATRARLIQQGQAVTRAAELSRLARLAQSAPRLSALARAGLYAGRAAATAGALALGPEVALAAGVAGVGAGAYYLGKRLRANKAKRDLPLLDAPPTKPFPVKTSPITHKPIVVPTLPIQNPMAPRNPKDESTSGRQRMRIPRRSRSVSIVTKAPAAIGNTIRGTASTVHMTTNGHVITGRDFMFAPIGSGSVTTWTVVGGCPLSPTAFADSSLRQYSEMYGKFRFLSFTAHYVTASPTSSNGDIMLYYAKNRESPFLNQTSPNLLPFVMSDPNTILGPQWQNISATFDVSATWKSLDYGIEDTPKDYADGELFLLSKTSTPDSPGYVIFDYTIEFGERSIQPRLLTFPITRELYLNMALSVPSGATTINTPFGLRNSGLTIAGVNSAYPVGQLDGDIYKVIVDFTNSTKGSNSTFVIQPLVSHDVSGSTLSYTMADGFTCYAIYNLAGDLYYFYPNAPAAYVGSRIFWASGTGSITLTLQVWMSYVGSINGAMNNLSNI